MRNVRHLALSVLACVALVCLLGLSSATAWARVGTIDEFPVPSAGGLPFWHHSRAGWQPLVHRG